VIYIWDYEKCSTHCYLQHHIISSTSKQGEALDTIILLIVGDHKEVVLQGCIHLFCLISGCWWLSHAVRCRITHGTCICPHTLEPYYRLLCTTIVMEGVGDISACRDRTLTVPEYMSSCTGEQNLTLFKAHTESLR
jgi:hypothetical protein